MYRRRSKAIGYLGEIDRLFGVSATTRNWNTINKIAKVLDRLELEADPVRDPSDVLSVLLEIWIERLTGSGEVLYR